MKIELFSGFAFFAFALGSAGCLLALQKLQSLQKGYSAGIALLSICLSAWLYGHAIWKAALFLLVAVLALYLQRTGLIAKRWAVVLILVPLVLGKITALPVLGIVGLSFATFRAIDVLLYADQKQPIKPLEYVAYLFFPLTLLAGPMYRWQAFCKDMAVGHSRINLDTTLRGGEILLLGIVQKFLLSETIDRFVLSNLPVGDYSIFGIAVTAVTYSAFLYFDFAGYSNMAIGIGRMLGLGIPRNFNNPIAASSPQDFWRRWHISLSDWLRDVVFMPVYMGLSKTQLFSRRRLFAQNIGIFLTLLIMGIWNGLSLHYIVSGVMFGTYSVVFNIIVNRSKSDPLLAWMFNNQICRFLGRILTIILAMLALYVFSGRSPI